jgi:hypothetical protein
VFEVQRRNYLRTGNPEMTIKREISPKLQEAFNDLPQVKATLVSWKNITDTEDLILARVDKSNKYTGRYSSGQLSTEYVVWHFNRKSGYLYSGQYFISDSYESEIEALEEAINCFKDISLGMYESRDP